MTSSQKGQLGLLSGSISYSNSFFCDVTDDTESQSLKVQAKHRSYDIISPSIVTSANVSIIEEENMANLSKCVNICLSTNVTYASSELLEHFRKIKEQHRKNAYFDSIEGARDFFNLCISIEKRRFVDAVLLLPCHGSDFNPFIKNSMIDFEINMLRISPMPTNDERTMFVKAVV
ncbi:hypothetical protein RO3G_07955 [Rhizopus delemar RA 99-880]|uniref:Uncharacterized protein n=1 Tax=Rhizopus delemar (strain RA 99-880 / ATCC MYA-4621 / FGSC 9543 / NRRL 43880) TaxID=246409 RepID=I1C470_RHIO9|nr:hypothetical protein RO3G_07955 [Rhizopus delemar RA 99-880]|eukprot:EIE83250.1 hypothetical protein RO3G_07955 [Rhizopus delemar RA 99-880]